MPFEQGNRFGRNVQLVTQALTRAVLADDAKLLRKACDRALKAASDGDLQALAWIADRLDGKAIARSEQVEGDVKALTLQDVARLVYQARAHEAVDATITLPAARQPPHPQGDTRVEAVGGEGVVAVGPTHTTPHENSPSSDSGGK